MALRAEELRRRSVELTIQGRYGAASRAVESALARTDDVDLRARLAGTRSIILQRTGLPGDAERTCRDALSTPGLSRHTRAVLEGQLGALAAFSGRLDEADALLRHAIDDLEADPVAQARTRINRSLVNLQRRRLADATDDLMRAAQTFEDNGLLTDAAQARHNLGYTALLAGDLVAALQDMRAARPGAATSAVSAAICDVDRAEVLRDAGLTTEAESILAKSAYTFSAHRMLQSRAETSFNLSRSLLTHDTAHARREAASAARTFRALENEAWEARAVALRMRAELSGGGFSRMGVRFSDLRHIPSSKEAESVASSLDGQGFRSEAAALRMTREIWRARHNAPDDGAAIVIRPPASASMEVRLLAHTARAERAVARGRHSEGRRHAARGLDVLTQWESDFGSLDLQTSIAMHGDALIGVGLRSAVRSGRPDLIFDWSERARHLMLQVIPLRPPPDDTTAAELAELRMLRAEGGSDWLANPRAADLQERARERQWSSTRSVALEERATLSEVRSSLERDTALISYVFSGDSLMALVATADRTSVVPIANWQRVHKAMPGLRAELDMAASVRNGPLAGTVRTSLRNRLVSLSTDLLDGPAERAAARRLVITTPAILNGIPWSMLPAMRGRAFTLAASATRWVRQRAELPASSRRTSIGFATGPRVARGDEEVDLASSAWNDAVLARQATVDDVADLAKRVDVLHIAAHGRHAVDNPMFSGLELADGTLFGYDIDRIDPVPSTVILSACEAGRSSVRWGEEAVGMTRIWLHAGTRCVIAAPVVVADDDACELLAAMHQGLAAGMPPSEALAAASHDTGIVAPFQAHGAGL